MYRRSVMEAEKLENIEEAPAGMEFVGRVSNLPVVQSAYSQLLSLYGRTKESNRLARFTLNTAESGISLALNTAQPLLAKLPVEKLDNLACGQLDKLENSYPIITKPTEQVVNKSMELYEATLKPTVDTVVAAGSRSVSVAHSVTVKPVVDVKEFTKQKMVSLKELGESTLERGKQTSLATVEQVMNSAYGQQVTGAVDQALTLTENLADKHLPPAPAENGQEAEVDDVEARTNLQRAVDLSNRVKHHMVILALHNLHTVQGHGRDLLAKLNVTADMLEVVRITGSATKQEVTSRLDTVRQRLTYIWSELQKTEEDICTEKAPENESTSDRLERMVIATARHLSSNMAHLYISLSQSVAGLPASLSSKMSEAGHISQTISYLFSSTKFEMKDVPQLSMTTLQTQLHHLNNLVTSVSNYTLDLITSSSLADYVMSKAKGQGSVEESTMEDEEMREDQD